MELLCQLLELLEHELNLGSNDDLHGVLARADNAGGAGGLDLSLVYQQTVLDFQTQAGDAVVNRSDVLCAAKTFQNDLRDGGEIVVGKLDLGFVLIVLTAERLPVLETVELHGQLTRSGVDVAGLVVNKRSPADGDLLAARRRQEEVHVGDLRRQLPDVPVVQLPLLGGDIVGADAVAEVAELLADAD